MGVLFTGVATVLSTVGQMSAERKKAKAEMEGRAISIASQKIQDRAARRRLAREERVRRARILASGNYAGASGSSGLLGATSALRSNVDQSLATQSSQELGAIGISAANQRASNAISSSYRWKSFAELAGTATDIYDKYNEGT